MIGGAVGCVAGGNGGGPSGFRVGGVPDGGGLPQKSSWPIENVILQMLER